MKCCGVEMDEQHPFGRPSYFLICRECLTVRYIDKRNLRVTEIGHK